MAVSRAPRLVSICRSSERDSGATPANRDLFPPRGSPTGVHTRWRISRELIAVLPTIGICASAFQAIILELPMPGADLFLPIVKISPAVRGAPKDFIGRVPEPNPYYPRWHF